MNTTLSSAPSAETTVASVVVRSATAEDYAGAVRLFHAHMGAGFDLDENLWKAVCTTDSHRAFVATTESGAVVGLAVVVVSDRIRLAAGIRRRRFHIDDLIVDPAVRRQGIGKAILEHLIAMARAERPAYIVVTCDFTNVAARRVYESAGLYLVRQSSDRFEIAFS